MLDLNLLTSAAKFVSDILLKNQTLVHIVGQRGHVRAELRPRVGRRQRELGGDREERPWRDVAVLQILCSDAAQVQAKDLRPGG